jgi:hypothetical protein
MFACGCGDLRDVPQLVCLSQVPVIKEDLGLGRADLEV